jgi:hypothetical protein
MTPLYVKGDIAEMFSHRRYRYSDFEITESEGRMVVRFGRYTESRKLEGCFEVEPLGEGYYLIFSVLDSDVLKDGPQYICERAFPLGKRPFLRFSSILDVISEFGNGGDLEMVGLTTWGLDNSTQAKRRDSKHQPLSKAYGEMVAQQRTPYKMRISFRNEKGSETFRATFDRNLQISVDVGPPDVLASDIMIPSLVRHWEQRHNYSILCQPDARQQEILTKTFPSKTFSSLDRMRNLCEVIRENGEGLGVSILHLNPYLHAQIIDYLAGSAYDLIILDDSTLSLVPQAPDPYGSLERISNLIGQFFLEPLREQRQPALSG